MIEDFSFGIIPYHIASKRFLIIRHRKDHWSFPKGHAEGNETPQETARRELREETNVIPVKIDSRIFSETYQFIHKGTSIQKKVVYFIGFIEETEVSIQEKELKDFAWLPYEEALSTITFENAQYILREAYAYLKTKNIV